MFEAEDLRRLSRSMAELQWLLLILVLLYYFIPIHPIADSDTLILIRVCYATSVIGFRYLNFLTRETRWKLAVETWLTIAFISLALWQRPDGKPAAASQPAGNYHLCHHARKGHDVAGGHADTCYLFMSQASCGDTIFSPETFNLLMAKLSPFLLVAYVTSMLADDILSAKNNIAMLSQMDELTGLLNLRAFNLILGNRKGCRRWPLRSAVASGQRTYSRAMVVTNLPSCWSAPAPRKREAQRSQPGQLLLRQRGRDRHLDCLMHSGVPCRNPPDRSEAAPVYRQNPQPFESIQVHLARIALVAGKAIARIGRVEFQHCPVTGHLGQD